MDRHIVKKIEVFDKAFLPGNSRYYRLSIRFAADGFSFLILDPQKKKFLYRAAYAFYGVRDAKHLSYILDYLFTSQALLNKDFAKTGILFQPPYQTLVPKVLYDESRKEEIARLNFPFTEEDVILANEVRDDLYLIFPVGKALIDFWQVNFPTSTILSTGKILLECLRLSSMQAPQNQHVFLHTGERHLDILVFQRNELIFFNSFRYHTPQDVSYYLLYVYQHLSLHTQSVPLWLLGKVRKGDAIYNQLYSYVKNIHLLRRNTEFEYSYLFEKAGEGEEYELIHLSLCE